MPPKYYITFISGNTEIIFGIYCSKKDLERLGIEQLNRTVKNPSNYKIKL